MPRNDRTTDSRGALGGNSATGAVPGEGAATPFKLRGGRQEYDPGNDHGLQAERNKRGLNGYSSSPPSGTELLSGIRNGKWLGGQKFGPLVFAVPGLLPAGVVVIAGKPFAGKGLLVLRFVLECAQGGKVFGIECEQRPSFYLALEDSDRRLQERCYGLLGCEEIPDAFEYITHIEPGKLVGLVAAWLAGHANGIVVIDTLGKVMERPLPGEGTYERDYRIMGLLTDVWKRHPESTIVVNTHTRKAKAEDFVEAISGTNAIPGAADTVLILDRKRGTAEGTLMLTSRELDEAQYAIKLVRPTGWSLDGDTLEQAAREVEQRNSRLDVRSQSVVDFVNASGEDGVTVAQVVEACELDYATAKASLARNTDAGYIRRLRRGLYGPFAKISVKGNGQEVESNGKGNGQAPASASDDEGNLPSQPRAPARNARSRAR